MKTGGSLALALLAGHQQGRWNGTYDITGDYNKDYYEDPCLHLY